jgi:hypothetical protein
LIDHLITKGITILQYADDTILCLQDDEEKARNVKMLLYIYEQMSGLKINFEKSEVVLMGGGAIIKLWSMQRYLIARLVVSL